MASKRTLPTQRDPHESSSQHDDSLTAALENAVANLREASKTLQLGSPQAAQDAGASAPSEQDTGVLSDGEQRSTLALIESVCQAESRTKAVERLARAICPATSSGNVRIGLGRGGLEKLFDLKLGWLGNDSSIFEWAKKRWHEDSSDAEVETDRAPTEPILITLEHPSDSKVCRIWIENDRAAANWIKAVEETVANVFWSRPHRPLPSWMSMTDARIKTGVGVAVVLVALMVMWPVPYRVQCSATVETVGQRYVATPFAATLDDVFVRPGDEVVAGQPLLEFDGRPLRLERESLQAQLQEAEKEQTVAMATQKIADAQQLALKCKKFRRQIELIDDQLGQVQVTSPIDGVVISGDLHRNIGSPIERGENLMEVAPMKQMVIEFEIPQHEIGYTTEGMPVRVRIDAVGGSSVNLAIEEIFPSAELREDQNVFVGQTVVDNSDGRLRPGMRGDAIAYGPMRPWIWSWTRSAIERVMWWVGF